LSQESTPEGVRHLGNVNCAGREEEWIPVTSTGMTEIGLLDEIEADEI